MSAAPKRKLFLSRSQLMFEINALRITQQDLDTGLFYMACTERWAFNYGNKSPTNRKIADALNKAQAEGRVEFIEFGDDDSRNWTQLDQLLTRNGFRPIRFRKADGHVHFSAGEAACRCEQLDVIHRGER